MFILLFVYFSSVVSVSLPQCHCTEYIPCTEANPIQKTFPQCVDHCKVGIHTMIHSPLLYLQKKHPDPLPPEYLPCLLALKEELTDTIDCIFEKVGLGCSSNEGNVIKGKNTTEMFRESVREKLAKHMDAVGAIWEYKTEAAEKVNRCLLRCFYPGRNVCTISMKCILYVPSDSEMADQLSSCARDSGIKAKERRKLAQCFALVTKKDDASHGHSPRDGKKEDKKKPAEKEGSEEEESQTEDDGDSQETEVELETSTTHRTPSTHKSRRPHHSRKITAYTPAPIENNPLNIIPVRLGTSQMSSLAQNNPNPVPVQGSSVAQAPTEDAYRVAPKPPNYPPRMNLTSQSNQLPEAETEETRLKPDPVDETQSQPNVRVYPIPAVQSNHVLTPTVEANQGNSVVSNQIGTDSNQVPNQVPSDFSNQIIQSNLQDSTSIASSPLNVNSIPVTPGSGTYQVSHVTVETPSAPVEVPVSTIAAPEVVTGVGYTVPPPSTQNNQVNQVPNSNQGLVDVASPNPSSTGIASTNNRNSSLGPNSVIPSAYPSNLDQIVSNSGDYPSSTETNINSAPIPAQTPSNNQVQSAPPPLTQPPPTEVKPACASVTEPGDIASPVEVSPPAPVNNQPPQQNLITVTPLDSAIPSSNSPSNPYVSHPIPQSRSVV